MPVCDMCGREARLLSAVVEGALIRVCEQCKGFGHVVAIPEPKPFQRETTKPVFEEPEEYIREDFADVIKKQREQLELTQEDLGKKLNERESVIHQVESGHMKPSMMLAQKFEKFFKIQLVEYHQMGPKKVAIDFDSKALTIGDLIKIKRKK